MSHYFQVNWVNGMRINSGHFIEMENHFIERIQQVAGGFVNPLSYGLLPLAENEGNTLSFSLSVQSGKIRSLRPFTVITPDGHLAHIPANQEFLLSKPETEASQYLLVLTVKAFNRAPYGEINELESPLRYPYSLPECQFHLFPYPHKSNHSFGPGIVPLGLYSGSSFEADPSYIPPCTSLQSHAALADLIRKTKAALDDFERKILELFRKPNVTNKPLLVSVLNFFNENKTALDWYIPYLPPVFLMEKIAQLSRGIFFTCETQNIPLKDDLKALLKDLIAFQYDHMEIAKARQKILQFLDNYSKFLPRDENMFGV
ncbi:MAG: hypothetical protein NTU44_06320 [Bacteroidetes bacterium]|nr:hypothetical protein [Bacteroidota bacterium]